MRSTVTSVSLIESSGGEITSGGYELHPFFHDPITVHHLNRSDPKFEKSFAKEMWLAIV